MCGICGVLSFQGKKFVLAKNHVTAMANSMSDRGPDNTSIWSGNNIVLGHTRLSIMDPTSSVANQPIESKRWVLVFNGEIYNFRELKKTLENKGEVFLSNCDTEVLIKVIEVFGINQGLKKINGIFAFCAYDKLTGSIYLVRDRLGVKPLYYWLDIENDHFWFASTPAAIVNATNKKWQLDERAVHSFFHLGAPATRGTFFKGIKRLRAAEKLVIDKQLHVSSEYYWTPSYREGEIMEQIESSILGEKESHVKSAVFLSGGIDSSLVASILGDVEAFHLASDEFKYAKYVTKKLDTNLYVREYTKDVSFDDLLTSYSISSGEASASSPIPLMVSKLISEEGFKVAFSANGADELFFGYPRTPTPELLPLNFPAVDYEALSVNSRIDQHYHIFRDEGSFNLPKLSYKCQGYEEAENLYEVRKIDDSFPESAHIRWYELQTYVGCDLNPTLDFASMACSLEVRVPFLDYRLVELALSQDANQLIQPDFGRKAPLKKMLKNRGFNPSLWSRQKVGFSIPDNILAKRDKGLTKHLAELEKAKLFKIGVFSRNKERDFQYLKSAAHAFNIWKKVWVDTGKVELQDG